MRVHGELAIDLGQAFEIDTARGLAAFFGGDAIILQIASESSIAQGLTMVPGGISRILTLATETDTSQVLNIQLTLDIPIALAAELDLSQVLQIQLGEVAQAITVALELDTAQGVTVFLPPQIVNLVRADEVDLSQTLGQLLQLQIPLTQIEETDTSQALAQQLVNIVPINRGAETDLARTLTAELGALMISLSPSQEFDFAQLLTILQGVPAFGGKYNAVAEFPTGQSDVTISLVEPLTGNPIGLDDAACTEIDNTGYYIWDSTKLTNHPSSYTEYLWTMDDGVTQVSGLLVILDHPVISYLRNKEVFG